MRFHSVLAALATTTFLSAPALAGPDIEYGARPDWVIPRTPSSPTPQENPDALQVLLQDTQIRFEDEGAVHYQRFVTRIGNPDGLASSNFSIEWNPETEDVIVHKLELRREGETIDILEEGQEFLVLRRETELEQATLNGHLTAHLQPEGVEVGDTLEMELSIRTRDPVVGGHAAEYVALGDIGNHGERHVRLLYPADRTVNVKRWPHTPEVKRAKEGDWQTLSWSHGKLETLTAPGRAPLRYRISQALEYSDYESWDALADTLRPHFDAAATIEEGSKLAAEVDEIAAASDDPIVRAEMALALVQERVRYVNMALGAGGLVPVDAETTWKRRFGDCKGKTVLLIAVLDRLGIESAPALVKSNGDDSIGEGLPMVGQFDHVIVKTEIGGKTYWLDGTRQGDSRLADIQVPTMDWALPLVEDTDIEALVVPPMRYPTRHLESTLDLSEGPFAPAKLAGAVHFYGAEATLIERNWDAFEEQMKRNLERMGQNPNALGEYEVEFSGREFDAEKSQLTIRYEMVTDEPYLMFDGQLGVASPSFFVAEERENVDFNEDAPFSLTHPMLSRSTATVIAPPDNPGLVVAVGGDVDHRFGGQRYLRALTREGDRVHVLTDMQSLDDEVAYSVAIDGKEQAEALNRDRLYFDLRLWTLQGDDIDRLVAFADELEAREFEDEKEEQAEYFAKSMRHHAAIAYEREGQSEKAAAIFDALTADADDAVAFNNLCWDKAVANVAIERALAECDAGIAMSRYPAILDSRALVYARLGRWQEAEADYDEALEDMDEDEGAVFRFGRSLARRALGQVAKADADASAALAMHPNVAAIYASYDIALPAATDSVTSAEKN